MKRIHLIISGRVQGVGFRFFCQSHAERLRLSGYARNREDGSVEVEAQGEYEALEEFSTLMQAGPRAAWVTNVARKDAPLNQTELDFRI